MENLCIENGSQIAVRFNPSASGGDITNIDFTVTTDPSLSYNSMASTTGTLTGNTLNIPVITAGTSEEIVVIVNVVDKDALNMKVYLQATTTTAQSSTTDDVGVFDITAEYNLFRGCSNGVGVSDNLGNHTATQSIDLANFPLLNVNIPEYEGRAEAFAAIGNKKLFRYADANIYGIPPGIDTTS